VCRWWRDDEGLRHPAVATVVDWFSVEDADAFVDANGQKGRWPNARAPRDPRRRTHTPSLPPTHPPKPASLTQIRYDGEGPLEGDHEDIEEGELLEAMHDCDRTRPGGRR